MIILPASKFFVRRIALAPGQAPAAQVELALEMFGPFSPAQLYHGYFPSKDKTQALVFAAYRRNFSAEETADWPTAKAVIPEIAFWAGQAPASKPAIWTYAHEQTVQVVAWDEAALPAGVFSRALDGQPAAQVTEELSALAAERHGVPSTATRELSGALEVERWNQEGLALKLDRPGQTAGLVLSPEVVRCLDVRDKSELANLDKQQQRNTWLWRGFAGLAAVLVLCAAGELAMLVRGGLLAKKKAASEQMAPVVQKIETAATLADRMEKIANQRLKLIGMLGALNESRPKPLTFIRTTISSPTQMEVEAQTANAADINTYEQALRSSPEIEKVEIRDQRSRDNVTTFQIVVQFKEGFPTEENDR